MTEPLTKHPNSAEKYTVILWFVILSVLSGVAAYYRMFTEFNFYDDEGTMILLVKQYLGGMTLYGRIGNTYGPVYYFYNWAVRTLSRTPVTHDTVRMSSLIPWLLTALVSAWIVFLLTDSLLLASATHLLTCLTLSTFFHNEPGHPQELCILLLVCLAASGIAASIPRWRLPGIILLGVLPAALLLVKINIGTFAFLAVSLALLLYSPKTMLSRLASIAVGAACVVLPVDLMKTRLDDHGARLYVVLVTVSVMSALLILFRVPRKPYFRFRDSWTAFAFFAITLVGIILVMKLHGVSMYVLLKALVLDSLRFVNQRPWYVAIPLSGRWLVWSMVSLAAAVLFSRRAGQKFRTEYNLLYLKLALALLTIVALFLRVPPFGLASSEFAHLPGLFTFIPPSFALVPPFCWLVLYGRPENDIDSYAFPRTLLCMLTILQTLYAFPIAGSQLGFIQVMPIIVIMICLGDCLPLLRKRFPIISPSILRVASSMLLLCLALSYIAIAMSKRERYNMLPALQLPGAGRIHLPPKQARNYEWLVQNLDDHCDIFVGLPELPSLHIWSRKDPLYGLENADWMISASDEEQIAAAATLSQHPNACAIYNPDIVSFWNRTNQDFSSLPLVHYLNENFKVVGTTGQYSFLVHSERNLAVESNP